MIAQQESISTVVRALAPLVWRSERKIAAKLLEYAETEAGSALDMLRAAELALDPRHRRLFFLHAIQEAQHAAMFRTLSRAIHPDPSSDLSAYASTHGRRQNLYAQLGLVRFLAFVHLAERRGEAQFRALAAHFDDRPEIAETFARICADERFHIRYSARLLGELKRAGVPGAKTALARARLAQAWAAWRRTGRRIGDLIAHAFLATMYLVVVPPFALLARRLDADRPGWKVR